MAKKLNRNLKDIKAEIQESNQSGFDFGVEFEFLGIGGKLSTENGGTIGIGVGIAGVEYNAQGGGSVEYLNGLYEMRVEISGCSQVKDYYIAGQYAYTEIEKIPGCDEEPEDIKPFSPLPSREIADRIVIPKSPSNSDFPKIPTGYSGWICPVIMMTNIEFWRVTTESDGSLRRVFGQNNISIEVIGWGDWSGRKTSKWISEKNNSGTRVWLQNTMIIPASYAGKPYITTSSASLSAFTKPMLVRPAVWYSWGWRFVNNEDDILEGYPTEFNIYCQNVSNYRERKSPRFIPLYKEKNMNKKCCFTEDDRLLLQLLTITTGALELPGLVPKTLRTITTESGEAITPLPAQFPAPEDTEPSSQQRSISSLLQLKLWQTQVLAELSGSGNNDALERIEKVLATEQLLTGGISFPESWLIPGVKPSKLTDPNKYRDYLSLWVAAQKHLDKVGINEVTVSLDDEGNLSKKYPTATLAIQAILESISNQPGTDNTNNLLSLLIAVAKMLIRVYTATAKTGMEVRQIADFLGYPVTQVTEEIPSSLDPSLGAFNASKSKGFDPKKSKYPTPQQLETNMAKVVKEIEKSPDSINEILSRFISDSFLLISYEKFDNSVDSILDTLQNKSLNLGSGFEDIS